MNNILLGKTIKAMYKLSGKTLNQLAEETDLTVDTINNLFYARIQKPGLAGVNALVRAMGFSIENLIGFMDSNAETNEGTDITELFTNYISSVNGTDAPVKPAKDTVKAAKTGISNEIEIINAEHERELERYKSAQQQYSDQINAQHAQQIKELEAHNDRLQALFDKGINDIKEMSAKECAHLENENARIKKTNKAMNIFIVIETMAIILILAFDLINKSVGWFR